MRQRLTLSMAVLAITLAAGCSNKVDDAALVTNIKSQMFSDAQLKDASLQVTSSNGQVTLAGSVPSDAARYEAFKVATQTPGVIKVNDQMSVQAAQTTPAQPEPAAVPVPAKKPEPLHKAQIKQTAPVGHTELAENNAPPPSAAEPPVQTPPDQPVADQPPAPARRHHRLLRHSRDRFRSPGVQL